MQRWKWTQISTNIEQTPFTTNQYAINLMAAFWFTGATRRWRKAELMLPMQLPCTRQSLQDGNTTSQEIEELSRLVAEHNRTTLSFRLKARTYGHRADELKAKAAGAHQRSEHYNETAKAHSNITVAHENELQSLLLNATKESEGAIGRLSSYLNKTVMRSNWIARTFGRTTVLNEVGGLLKNQLKDLNDANEQNKEAAGNRSIAKRESEKATGEKANAQTFDMEAEEMRNFSKELYAMADENHQVKFKALQDLNVSLLRQKRGKLDDANTFQNVGGKLERQADQKQNEASDYKNRGDKLLNRSSAEYDSAKREEILAAVDEYKLSSHVGRARATRDEGFKATSISVALVVLALALCVMSTLMELANDVPSNASFVSPLTCVSVVEAERSQYGSTATRSSSSGAAVLDSDSNIMDTEAGQGTTKGESVPLLMGGVVAQ